MKVTSYYPVFYTEDLEAEVKRYTEDLGFTVIHKNRVKDYEYLVLENHGNRVDLLNTGLPFSSYSTGLYGIRVNVDNFEEGREYFVKQGYKQAGESKEDDSSIVAVLVGKNGMRIVLFHHKK